MFTRGVTVALLQVALPSVCLFLPPLLFLVYFGDLGNAAKQLANGGLLTLSVVVIFAAMADIYNSAEDPRILPVFKEVQACFVYGVVGLFFLPFVVLGYFFLEAQILSPPSPRATAPFEAMSAFCFLFYVFSLYRILYSYRRAAPFFKS